MGEFFDKLRSCIKSDEEIEAFHTIEHGMSIGTIEIEDAIYENAHLNIDDKKLKNMEVWVYQDEGCKPHFHVINPEKGFYCVILFEKSEYFPHGKYKDTLSSSEKRALQKFLSTPFDDGFTKARTRWHYLASIWNSTSNEKYKVKVHEMPDYTLLPDKKKRK